MRRRWPSVLPRRRDAKSDLKAHERRSITSRPGIRVRKLIEVQRIHRKALWQLTIDIVQRLNGLSARQPGNTASENCFPAPLSPNQVEAIEPDRCPDGSSDSSERFLQRDSVFRNNAGGYRSIANEPSLVSRSADGGQPKRILLDSLSRGVYRGGRAPGPHRLSHRPNAEQNEHEYRCDGCGVQRRNGSRSGMPLAVAAEGQRFG